jgi:hypothetical protein
MSIEAGYVCGPRTSLSPDMKWRPGVQWRLESAIDNKALLGMELKEVPGTQGISDKAWEAKQSPQAE